MPPMILPSANTESKKTEARLDQAITVNTAPKPNSAAAHDLNAERERCWNQYTAGGMGRSTAGIRTGTGNTEPYSGPPGRIGGPRASSATLT